MEQNLRYCITGGPGSGKSSLIDALRETGYFCFEEASRQIIRSQQAKQGDCVPWKNLSGFARLNRQMMIRQHQSAPVAPSFFDRALPDIPAYFNFRNQTLPEIFTQTIRKFRYNAIVFACPPWEKIFINDPERPESFEDSCKIYRHLLNSYHCHGYHIIKLPLTTLTGRIDFIHSILHRSGVLVSTMNHPNRMIG